ncbi:hypothetical protein LCGC14_2423970 [marine sediment metagenome]|uniref:Uncharacterized protein n=1 Tax=marine sediment metagenome TaxID=412755 RepID=A0A0F9E0X6_9ZZZZ
MTFKKIDLFERKEKGFDPKANYCTYFPDEMFGVTYKYGCYLHDRQYRNERKKRLTRVDTDVQLFNAVRYYFRKANKNFIGFFWAFLMYLGVRILCKWNWVKQK